jgi:hypothetical protein
MIDCPSMIARSEVMERRCLKGVALGFVGSRVGYCASGVEGGLFLRRWLPRAGANSRNDQAEGAVFPQELDG